MVANFLIGLREGLEATLVVSILIAYLVQAGHRERLPAVWSGVAAALALALGFGAVLTFTASNLSFEAQEAFGGAMSLIAVAFVTWMIFWMKRAARTMRAQLHGRMAAAVAMGTVAVAATAFLAVGREGLETALFLWAAIQSSTSTAVPLAGAALGIATSVVIGWLLYRRAISIDLRRFFTVTGAALIVVAAGVLAYGLHDLQEAGLLPGLTVHAFDVSALIPPSSWYGSLLKGIFNFSPAPSVVETTAWLAYVTVTMTLFFRSARVASAPVPAPVPAEAAASVAPTADTVAEAATA